jgi:plasmid replication initiation protein
LAFQIFFLSLHPKSKQKREWGIMKFIVADWVMTALLDYTHGFREFELETMMKLNSPYAMRFYELVANQDTGTPINMKVETLREWMGIKEGEYLRSWDFKRRIIDPSKKELDANCPWSFVLVELVLPCYFVIKCSIPDAAIHAL